MHMSKRAILRTKKYLYVLRPILACRWIEAGHGPVPMGMAVLVDALLQGERKAAIQELIARKQQEKNSSEGRGCRCSTR